MLSEGWERTFRVVGSRVLSGVGIILRWIIGPKLRLVGKLDFGRASE